MGKLPKDVSYEQGAMEIPF
ncbi:hypothetical protein CGLO_14586 [Colletotrichum gloeosporioides Cg-14]|uniref:Uncharacterized protein n=1 Tax=Colletotrichum gloeosporioides (strain Cg-14) TaxID=1237896 RepID=T0K0T0_COLGC|nr:hypothetical protein CGLO_14586 [Colletotrichum gloeosporioides Cg-14]